MRIDVTIVKLTPFTRFEVIAQTVVSALNNICWKIKTGKKACSFCGTRFFFTEIIL